MIGRPDIVERVAEWQLTEEIVEKDYMLGWLLWGIGADSILGNQWYSRKELRHRKRDSTLRAHKDPGGYPCRGRRGIYMGARY